MDLKKFLEDNPIINQSQLALAMYPDNPKTAKTRLSNKLNNAKAGSGKQRMLDDDNNRAIIALEKLGVNIKEFTNSTK